jgi:uncharacterized membrane protein YkvA (DUF1232 family)
MTPQFRRFEAEPAGHRGPQARGQETVVKVQVTQHLRRGRPWDIVRAIAHLPNFVKLYFRLLSDRRIGFWPKALLVGAIVYAVSPLDLIPDAIPVIGEMDDLAVMLFACRTFIRLCPQEIVQEHVQLIDRTGAWAPFAA